MHNKIWKKFSKIGEILGSDLQILGFWPFLAFF